MNKTNKIQNPTLLYICLTFSECFIGLIPSTVLAGQPKIFRNFVFNRTVASFGSNNLPLMTYENQK
jgi:hypothetical protein